MSMCFLRPITHPTHEYVLSKAHDTPYTYSSHTLSDEPCMKEYSCCLFKWKSEFYFNPGVWQSAPSRSLFDYERKHVYILLTCSSNTLKVFFSFFFWRVTDCPMTLDRYIHNMWMFFMMLIKNTFFFLVRDRLHHGSWWWGMQQPAGVACGRAGTISENI